MTSEERDALWRQLMAEQCAAAASDTTVTPLDNTRSEAV